MDRSLLLFVALACCSQAAAQEAAPEQADARTRAGLAFARAAVRDYEQNQHNDMRLIGEDDFGVPGLLIESTRPFSRGRSLLFAPRTFYMERNHEVLPDDSGWALGGSLAWLSGWLQERWQLGATLFASQPLDGSRDHDETSLFAAGGKPITVLGHAFLTLRLGQDHAIRVGRIPVDVPYANSNDTRMVPNTFQGVIFGRSVLRGFQWTGLYADRIKLRNSDEFVPMSEAAGAPGSDEGLAGLGARYVTHAGDLVAAGGQVSLDAFNTLFFKAEKSFLVGENASVRLFGQYTDQRSSGQALLGEFQTHMYSAKIALYLPHMDFRLGWSSTGSGSDIHSPYGAPPNYTSLMVRNFDRAGEQAWTAGASYDFARTGLPGLSVFANVAYGQTPDRGPWASPDTTEYDLTVDYRFARASALHGLWIRLRSSWVDEDESVASGHDLLDVRLIVNYAFDFL